MSFNACQNPLGQNKVQGFFMSLTLFSKGLSLLEQGDGELDPKALLAQPTIAFNN